MQADEYSIDSKIYKLAGSTFIKEEAIGGQENRIMRMCVSYHCNDISPFRIHERFSIEMERIACWSFSRRLRRDLFCQFHRKMSSLRGFSPHTHGTIVVAQPGKLKI